MFMFHLISCPPMRFTAFSSKTTFLLPLVSVIVILKLSKQPYIRTGFIALRDSSACAEIKMHLILLVSTFYFILQKLIFVCP